MWKSLLLILPVFVPSWRFFKSVEPSPRVQWALLDASSSSDAKWHDLAAPIVQLDPLSAFKRLFWNPHWNDALFIVSCAERIHQQPTEHSIYEIRRRVLRDLQETTDQIAGDFVQFRLVFVRREGSEIRREIVFTSNATKIPGPDAI